MTPSEVIAKILEASESMKRPAFRGHADAGWKLRSGAFRRLARAYGNWVLKDKKKLRELLDEYHREQLLVPMEIIDGKQMSPIQRLSILQHQRAATGLLDFTENALIALWFACADELQKDGAILVLDIGDEVLASNGRTKDQPFDAKSPVVYYEPDRSLGARIIAQRSVLVICDSSFDSSDVPSVRVPKGAKRRVLKYLKQLGMSETWLFGDVPGLATANTVEKPLRPTKPLPPKQYRSRGIQAYRNALYEEALEEYELFGTAVPEFAEPYSLQGDALSALGHFPEAIEAYTTAIENMDRPVYIGKGTVVSGETVSKEMLHAIYYNRGNVHAAIGNHLDAIADFNRALKQDEKYKALLLYNRGNSKYALQEFPEAYEDFEVAWLGSGRSSAALAMGNCKLLMGELDEGMQRYMDGGDKPPEGAASQCNSHGWLMSHIFERLKGINYKVKRKAYVLTVVAECEPASVSFMGNLGNVGNIPLGVTKSPSREGFPEVRGFVVHVVRPPTEP